MSDAAAAAPSAPAAAPAAPVTNTAPVTDKTPAGIPGDDSDMFDEADSFHGFMDQVKAREKALAKKAEPKTTIAQPKVTAPPAAAESDEGELEDEGDEGDDAAALAAAVDPDGAPDAEALAAEQAADAEQWAKIKAFMKQGGEVPEELKDVPVVLPNGSIETWGEVMNGFMRQDDHTRGWQEADAKVQRAEGALNAYKQHFDAIDNPDAKLAGEAMYEIYTRNGRRKAAKEFAIKLAGEEQEDIDAAWGTMIAVGRRLGINDPNHHEMKNAYERALADREARREQQDQNRAQQWEIDRLKNTRNQEAEQAKAAELQKNVQKQLEQLMPRAFKGVGVQMDAETDMIFRNKLSARLQQTGAVKITPELCVEAAKMMRDQLQRDREARAGVRKAKPKPKGFTPTLGGGSGPAKKPGSAGEDLSDDDAFAKKYGLKSW